MQESIAEVVLHTKTQPLLRIIYKFCKISNSYDSDHDTDTHASWPLFRHGYITEHLITEQITVRPIEGPGF